VKRVNVHYEVSGPPAARRTHPLSASADVEQEGWYVDSERVAVAALWREGSLYLAGDRIERVRGEAVEQLVAGDEQPPGVPAMPSLRWVKLEPELGERYLAVATTTAAAPSRGLLARLLGKARAEAELAKLTVDVVDEPEPADLPSWLAALLERKVDITWTGNESGGGFVHAIRRPLAPGEQVRDALLDHAREDAELAGLMREHVESWIEDSREQADEAGRLVADDPTRGWIEDLEFDAIAANVEASAGAWLDAYSSTARPVWRLHIPGPGILAALRRYVDRPAIVAVHSAPREAVLAVHLIGGVDRSSGELVGFALQRVWT
jgi:hypothetical protein